MRGYYRLYEDPPTEKEVVSFMSLNQNDLKTGGARMPQGETRIIFVKSAIGEK